MAMFKLQLKIALKEKMVFFYTLIIPIIMVFINKGPSFRDNEVLYLYWAYIVVTTILNGFLMNVIQLRENGFLKTLSYLAGSRFSVVMSSFLVQLLIIQVEILLFNLVVTIFITPVSPWTFLYSFLVSFLAVFLCAAMLSGLLILKVKQNTFTVIINLFLLIGIFLLGIRPQRTWNYFLTVFNPFQLIYGLYNVPYTTVAFGIFEGTCTFVYLVMGFFIFDKISIKSQLSRV